MTISSTNRKAGPYSGNDVAVAFPFSFKVFGASDLYVVRADSTGAETALVLNSDYTVALNSDQDSNPGGTITLPVALATGYTLTITSKVDNLQPVDLTNQGGFYPKVLTAALDRLTILVQQLAESVARSLKTSVSTPSGVDPQLPTPVAGNVLGWNSAGTSIINYAAQAGTSLIDLAASGGSNLVGFLQSGVGAVTRTLQSKARETVSVKDFGAKGDGVTNDVAAFQSAVTALMNAGGGTLYVPAGVYKIVGQITQDRSSNTALGVVSIIGAGRNAVTIIHSGATSLFSVVGHATIGEGQSKEIKISGMTLIGANTANQTAIGFTYVSFPHLEDLHIEAFDYGYYFQDVDHCSFSACIARFNMRGLFTRINPAPTSNSTDPNQYTFDECHFGNNSYYAIYNGGGSNWAFIGGSIESNGGSDSVNGFGYKAEDCAYQGGAVCCFSGTYFESNNGIADVVLINTTTTDPVLTDATYNFIGCSFNRASATLKSTNVILTNFASIAKVGNQILNLVGCTFKSYNAYTPSAGTPYINFSGVQTRSAKNFSAPGTIFEDAVEAPSYVQNIAKPFVELSKNGNQTINDATPTVWQLDTTNYGFSWGTTVNGSFQIAIPESGVYEICANITMSVSITGTHTISILCGALVALSNSFTNTDVLSVSGAKYFNAGDLISVQVTQNSGGAATAVGSASAISFLNITKKVDA